MGKIVRRFKCGAIVATIWENEAEKGSYNTISLERRYKDKNDEWKSTGSMRTSDIPKANLALAKAYEFLTNVEEIDPEATK